MQAKRLKKVLMHMRMNPGLSRPSLPTAQTRAMLTQLHRQDTDAMVPARARIKLLSAKIALQTPAMEKTAKAAARIRVARVALTMSHFAAKSSGSCEVRAHMSSHATLESAEKLAAATSIDASMSHRLISTFVCAPPPKEAVHIGKNNAARLSAATTTFIKIVTKLTADIAFTCTGGEPCAAREQTRGARRQHLWRQQHQQARAKPATLDQDSCSPSVGMAPANRARPNGP
mmetsp:Transcript_40545/g.71313  ORF Transcript_40545/g.71313 Transcript_40545/m.71313 type:complete len:231 (+) Transcript_40545:1434-2126(+)